ncbi:DUF3800 domain-containing protein [Porphyrobacter algicida]|uniref:DUF3800 domain-containing protein n=1 Tax=Qipengyuania algicida TaxID=1836209 RepID=A0A845AB71_9SPHN|nr:DUF3800 domain-containing protein [Qipengyuania algicida]MXP27672.1 DUF3800 domain-containing protein [Qipengyuania algicida]
MATTIYLDESGFTGDDLYNPEQRFFTIASTILEEEEARKILARCFPRYQGNEYKFTNIWKRERSREGLRALAAEIPRFADHAFVWIIDKRFCLLTKLVDYLVEPGAYEAGYDWYADGWGLRYLNTIHRDLVTHRADELYDGMIRAWDAFARDPTNERLDSLKELFERGKATTEAPLPSLFDLLLRGMEHFRKRNTNLAHFMDTSEIQVTSVFSSITWWRQQRSEDFALVHDESSSFLKQRDVWDTMLRDDFIAPPFPIANGTEVELPLRVRSSTAVCSHDSHSVQLCDILAGLLAKAGPGLVGGSHDPFIVDLVRSGAGALNYSGVMPHALYVDGPPQRRVGPDMVDRMIELLRPYLDQKMAERESFDG